MSQTASTSTEPRSRPSSSWTVSGVLWRAARAIARHPLRSVLILGAAPTLWALPEALLQDHPTVAALGPALAFQLVAAAWSALLSGGTVIASIELAAGGRPSLGALVRGIRFSPAVFLALALQLVPLQVLSRAMETSSVQQVLALAVGAPVVLVLAVRAVAWIPMIVDRRLGPIQAFRASWDVTRGSSGRILVVWAVPVTLAIAAGALAFGNPITVHVVGLAVGPVFSVVLAELYLALVADRTNPPAERSGWTRDASSG